MTQLSYLYNLECPKHMSAFDIMLVSRHNQSNKVNRTAYFMKANNDKQVLKIESL